MRWLVLALVGCGRIAFDPHGDGPAMTTDVAPGSDAPGGAITFVQEHGNGMTNVAAVDVAFTAPVTKGDLLVVGIDFGSVTPTIVSLTDDLHDGYAFLGPSDGALREYIAYAIASASGADTVHVAISEAAVYLELRLHEYSGVSATTPNDGFSKNASDTMPATVSVTTHVPGQLVFAMTIFSAAVTSTPGTGFTPRDTYAADMTEDRIVDLPATIDATTNYSAFSQWTAIAAVFDPE